MNKEQRWGARYAHKSDAFSATCGWVLEAEMLLKKLPKTGTVLDFACNTGRFIEMAMAVRPDLKYVGVDINNAALDIARVRVPAATWVSDLSEVDSDSVTLIVTTHALPQLEYPEHEFTELWRVLIRGGQLIALTNNKFNDWVYWVSNWFTGYRHDSTRFANYSMNEVRRLFKDSGFNCQDVHLYGKSPLFLSMLKPRVYCLGTKGGFI